MQCTYNELKSKAKIVRGKTSKRETLCSGILFYSIHVIYHFNNFGIGVFSLRTH